MRALVVDDSRVMRMILRRLLNDLGYETAEASGGREGLERLREMARPEVVLVDWHMPDMDGPEFVGAVRAAGDYDGVRIVMVTGEGGAAHAAAARQAGADAFLPKPPGPDALRAALTSPAPALV